MIAMYAILVVSTIIIGSALIRGQCTGELWALPAAVFVVLSALIWPLVVYWFWPVLLIVGIGALFFTGLVVVSMWIIGR